LGFDARRVLLVSVDPKTAAATEATRTELLRQVVERIAAAPEVESAAWADRAPFLGHSFGEFQNDRGAEVRSQRARVSGSYFDVLRIPLLAGRTFTRAEVESAAPVAVINDTAARRFWPGEDALGRKIRRHEGLKNELPHPAYTVIGIVKTVHSTYVSKPDGPALYFPEPLSSRSALLMMRTRVRPENVMHTALAAVAAVNGDLPSQTVTMPLDQGPVELQKMMSEAPAMAASALGAMALLLAAVGIFGLVSQLVAQRTREIAIRVAMGAQGRDVARLVAVETLRPVAAGSVFGLAGAAGLAALLRTMIVSPDTPDLTYGAGAFDLPTLCGALLILGAAVCLAGFVPARRALHIAPAEALRSE
jgi:hypothetical protein